MSVRDVGENLLLEKLRENGRSLRSTRRAESSAFAGKGDEELVRALGALDPGETGFKGTTIEVSGDRRIVKPSPETIAALESLLPKAFQRLVVRLKELDREPWRVDFGAGKGEDSFLLPGARRELSSSASISNRSGRLGRGAPQVCGYRMGSILSSCL